MTWDTATERDLEICALQLGRPMRDVLGIGARCVCGAPTVVVTKPRLSHGEPFPTIFYLTHPGATAALSTLEANGYMAQMQEQLTLDPEFAAAYTAAHQAYLDVCESLAHVDEIAGISAGGMPTRVKCLHALAAHSLAAGPGVNPVGDAALADCAWSPAVCVCAPDARG
ncbi:MAG: DUF501 domain-containing protein [Microbacteriaceae bacterium]